MKLNVWFETPNKYIEDPCVIVSVALSIFSERKLIDTFCLNFLLWFSAIPHFTASKVSQYGVFSRPYFPVFSPNAGKYGPRKTQYLDTFHAVFL